MSEAEALLEHGLPRLATLIVAELQRAGRVGSADFGAVRSGSVRGPRHGADPDY
jgi:hypothetical protein